MHRDTRIIRPQPQRYEFSREGIENDSLEKLTLEEVPGGRETMHWFELKLK